MFKKKIFQICLIVLWLCLFTKSPIFAADFSFDYDIVYNVFENGNTQVIQNIILTNNISNYYASNYAITIFSENISQVQAADPDGVIIPQVSQHDGKTTISLNFNKKNVGINSKMPFKLSFINTDIAVRKGKIWEIIIPGIEKNEQLHSYAVHLSIPKSFGKMVYQYPLPNQNNYWTLQELNNGGITAAYGDQQIYKYQLNYHLQNVTNSKQYQTITLPPETAYQKNIINNFNFIPENVEIDPDGNWIGSYILKPHEKKDIVVSGNIITFIEPQIDFINNQRQVNLNTYLKEQPYWEQTQAIKNKANELKTPKKIYDFVSNYLTYDFNRVTQNQQRLGADNALKNPQSAVCLEYSDLFVTLARSANIPAREIHGYAYTTNAKLQPILTTSDVLHAWAEYYDNSKQQWLPVDPTWGHTTYGVDYFSKLDFNHIALAILGQNSQYPLPVGTESNSDDKTKDIFINFETQYISLPQSKISIDLQNNKNISLISYNNYLLIKNKGTTIFYLSDVSYNGILNITIDKTKLQNIPPFGHLNLPIIIKSPLVFSQTSYQAIFKINGQEYQQIISIYPIYQSWEFIILIIFLIIIIVIISLYVRKSKKTNS